MRTSAVTLSLLVACCLVASPARSNDWIFDSGPYTRSPKTGKRVDQYKKAAPSRRVPYAQYFSPDGPGAYIPWTYWEDELGPLNGYFGGGGAGNFGGGAYGGTLPGTGGYGFAY